MEFLIASVLLLIATALATAAAGALLRLVFFFMTRGIRSAATHTTGSLALPRSSA